MKNNIVFKFIAILLCTLTLLGSLGSALGLYVMSEADLYNKTADQVRDELIWERGETLAHEAARTYASQTLGGCPEDMTNLVLGNYWKSGLFRSGSYGYRILDAEGNEVFSQGHVDPATPYTFPVEGQYFHLVSMETEQEIALREAQERAGRYSLTASVDGMEIPPEGLVVNYASFVNQEGALVMELFDEGTTTIRIRYDENGAVTENIDNIGVGYLMYTNNGHLVFHSKAVYPYESLDEPILEANFVAPDNTQLKLRDENVGVGNLFIDDHGTLFFVSQEPVPQTGEGLPAPALTIDQTPGLTAINNTVPAEGAAIVLAAFYGPDGTVLFQEYDADGLGYLYYNQEGGLSFVQKNPESFDKGACLTALENSAVAGVYFQDAEGTAVYEATSIDGVGEADASESRLVWKSLVPKPAPVETQPETVEEAPPAEEGAGENQEGGENQEAPQEGTPEAPQEGEPSSASDIPQEQPVEAYVETQPAVAEATVQVETQAPETQPPETTVPPTEEPTVPTEEAFVPTEPVIINGKPLDEYQTSRQEYYDTEKGQTVHVTYVRVPMPQYTVELTLASDALQYENLYTILHYLRAYRKVLLPALGICLLVLAMSAVYLCTAAGRKPRSEEIRASGLNRLPLDLYFCIGFGLAAFAGVTGVKALDRLGWNLVFNAALALGTALGICLVIVAFCFAVAAQVKMPGGFWWRNTLCGHAFRLMTKFALWLEYFLADKGFPFLGRLLKDCWKLVKAACVAYYHAMVFLANGFVRFCKWLFGGIYRFLSLLPITWQWLLTGCTIFFIAILTLDTPSGVLGLLGVMSVMAIIVYGAHCFGVLHETTRNMSKGDLETKADDKLLIGCFKDFAGDLNALADVAVVAAQKQLKSERMKTELITNVSHDIKTPLTSIINYVDLLQKPHTEEEQAQYLEVLDRQSQRLKKLIDDLMDMSKASTGNMAVEITTVDAVESVNQALGEFCDKLSAARLTPVFRHSQENVPIRADGKLVWRVMSNLLSNAVKYAMPGTRLYIDLMELEGKVVLSLKNISREELNVDAEELMERFVRGDDSRNTEGSGLGLNIAKSLMELQKGQLQLLVDGDLFKVTLIFPGD